MSLSCFYLLFSRENNSFEGIVFKMKKNVTIKDIAREIGVHHTTVSLALRNSKSIKKDTRKKIWDKATELGYRPNRLAQGFRNKRSNSIGVLVPSIQHHFFAKFISEVTKRANDAGFSVLIFQSNEKIETEKRNVEALIENRVAGVIASISQETSDAEHFTLFYKEQIPLVFFDRVPNQQNILKVTANNVQGAYDAVHMMIQTGKQRIAFITGASHLNVYHDRLAGYRQALSENGISFSDELLIVADFFLKDGIKGAKQLMSLCDKPDAILAVGDDVGIGVIKYLKSNGFRIPEDVAVIGFDNDPMGLAIDPELTTVKQPVEQMAENALLMLLEKIESNDVKIKEKILDTHILKRQSC